MSVKDIILTIVSYCSLKFIDRLIEDNMPDMHYKKLITGFNKHIAPVLLIAYLGYLSLIVKITRSQELEKEYFELLVVLALTTFFYKKYQDKKISSNIY